MDITNPYNSRGYVVQQRIFTLANVGATPDLVHAEASTIYLSGDDSAIPRQRSSRDARNAPRTGYSLLLNPHP